MSNSTPLSSTRPSVDLQSASSRTSSPAPNPANRRHRAALRDYYNLQSRGSPSSSEAASTTTFPVIPQSSNVPRASSSSCPTSASRPSTRGTINPNSRASNQLTRQSAQEPDLAEIDTPDFSVTEYVRTVLATQNLSQLMKTEGGLVNEIRGLDGEKKALVYDNYSKLLGATEVIRGMSRVGVLDDPEGEGELRRTPVTAMINHLPGGLGDETKEDGWKVEGLQERIVGIMEAASALGGPIPASVAVSSPAGLAIPKLNPTGDDSVEQEPEHEYPVPPQSARPDVTSFPESSPAQAQGIRLVETPRMRQRRKMTVKWVLAAPDRVNKMVREGRGVEAAREWGEVKKILDMWGMKGVKGVDEVKRRGEGAFSGV